MSFQLLPMDMILEIAKCDEIAWWKLWLYVDEFREVTRMNVNLFESLFSRLVEVRGALVWELLDTIHRGNGLPAVIDDKGCMEWMVNGMYHREGDLPAMVVFYKGIEGDDLWENRYKNIQDNSFFETYHIFRSRKWKIRDKLHRDNDQPAIITPHSQQWYYNGEKHRENDQPAVLYSDGRQEWWHNDKKHRDGASDLPAVIYADGTREWWYNDKKHRDKASDLPAVIYADGTQEWWYNGNRHRENDMPAVIYAHGTKEWWYNGKRHRDGGKPARIMPTINATEWYFEDKRYDKINVPRTFTQKEKNSIVIEEKNDVCSSLTQKGIRCKNKAKTDGRCHIHTK